MDDKESYDKFLLKEYDNIAQAHFNTKNSLIQFFRYYLLIIALPLPLFVVLAGRMPTTTGQAEMFSLLINRFIDIIPMISLILAIVGFFVMCYMSNLHFDALLYARQVNGIRWYFTRKSKLSAEDLDKIKVLPTDNKFPVFTKEHSIRYVIAVFGIINGTYFYFTFHHFLTYGRTIAFILIVGSSIAFHLWMHRHEAKKALEKW